MSILDQVLYVLDNNIYSEELLMAEYNNVQKPPAQNKSSKKSKSPDTGQKHRNDEEDNDGDNLHVDTDDSEFELEGLDDIDLIDERKIKKLVKSEETILEELGHL